MSARSDAALSLAGWIDNQGDVWTLGADGLMHTPETAPFPREYVERKWGPLKPYSQADTVAANIAKIKGAKR